MARIPDRLTGAGFILKGSDMLFGARYNLTVIQHEDPYQTLQKRGKLDGFQEIEGTVSLSPGDFLEFAQTYTLRMADGAECEFLNLGGDFGLVPVYPIKVISQIRPGP